MDFESKQIPPPRDWERFEEICLALWQDIWTDPLAMKNGRRGQKQSGVDIYGRPSGTDAFWGIQCKGKDQGYGNVLNFAEVVEEVKKAVGFSPRLASYIIITTAPRDAQLQLQVRELSEERTAVGSFPVTVLAWEDVQSLIGRHRPVLERFYPEHAADSSSLLARLALMPSGEDVQRLIRMVNTNVELLTDAVSADGWIDVVFSAERDLGPALLGRGLGPGDALVCPRLEEADIIVQELQRAFAARLTGVPGAGKSVCCYQAAATLVQQGWSVKVLCRPPPSIIHFPEHRPDSRVLYIVDDAHRLPLWTIQNLEHQTSPSRYFLTTFNAAEAAGHGEGVALDASRAVRTIARSLRADPNCREVVKRVDDQVGERFLEEDVLARIDAAERDSTYPWQFCFILGGGWRRATHLAASCRANGAAYVIAAIALLQLVTRDKGTSLDVLGDLLQPAAIEGSELRRAVEWLIKQRLVLGERDLRTPHQRFAVALLVALGRSDNSAERSVLQELCRHAVTHPESTLGGIRLLMRELRFGDHWLEPRFWVSGVAGQLRQRCFAAETPEDRMYACLYLAEQHGRPWSSWDFLDEGAMSLIGRWISEVQHPTGYGLHQLLNNTYNDDPDLMLRLVAASDPVRVAAAVSSVSLESAWSMFEMVDRMALGKATAWRDAFLAALDRKRLVSEMRTWTDLEWGTNVASKVCWALAMHDERFGWEVLEAITPLFRAAFAADAVRSFRLTDNVISNFLRVWNPLGVGQKPNSRQLAAVRSLLQDVDIVQTAKRLSACTWREMNDASHFLGFVLAADSARARKLLAAMNLERISESIGTRWASLDHESTVYLCQFARDKHSGARLETLVLSKVPEIQELPARLALAVPSAGVRVLQAGRHVTLGSEMGLGWNLVAMLTYRIGNLAPDLLPEMIRPNLAKAAESWQARQVNLYENVDVFVCLLEQHGMTDLLQEIIAQLHPGEIQAAWTAVLRNGGPAARSVALLVDHALSSEVESVREVAASLRKQFPSTSKLTKEARRKFLHT